MFGKYSKYSKFIVAIAGAVVAFLTAHYGVGSDTTRTVIEVLTALGVYQVPNS